MTVNRVNALKRLMCEGLKTDNFLDRLEADPTRLERRLIALRNAPIDTSRLLAAWHHTGSLSIQYQVYSNGRLYDL
jgi:hypothetical protein